MVGFYGEGGKEGYTLFNIRVFQQRVKRVITLLRAVPLAGGNVLEKFICKGRYLAFR